jgi:hypothetical protein
MKRILMILIAIACVGISVNAKDGQGSCVVNNTTDYASVDFYKGGSLGKGNFIIVYSTSGENPLTSVNVTITAEIKKATGYDWESVTLYDETLYGIPANKSLPSIEVKMPQYNDIKDIQVTVKNPVCK